jgi:hypothetical protein
MRHVIMKKNTKRIGDKMAKTTNLAVTIACTVLFTGLVVAQPSAPNPGPPEVPEVTQEEAGKPVAPAEPSTAGEEPAVGVGALGNHCECPLKHCANGDVSWCEVHCSGGEAPVCSCDGFCDSDGNPKALNRCACQ